jgi:epoxyqueuosine reductase
MAPSLTLTQELKSVALAAGFDGVGVCAATSWPEMARLDEWLARGDHGDMWYMEQRRSLRLSPAAFFAPARMAVMVVKAYSPGPSQGPLSPGEAEVSRHAVGEDYHRLMRRLLRPIKERLGRGGFRYRAFTDAAPVMEKVLAVRAGLGVMGRNTLLYHPVHGSWVFIGGVMTDAPLTPDQPLSPHDPCGTCRRCIDSCPGGALRADGSLDARRCLSYWTTESRAPAFPAAIEAALGQRVFGCDRCQEVCPMNASRAGGALAGGTRRYALEALSRLGEDGFRARFGGTTMARLGWPLFARNVAAIATPSQNCDSSS